MVRISLRVSEEFDSALEDELGYGGNKSEFYRKAAHERFEQLCSGEISLTEKEVGNRSEADA